MASPIVDSEGFKNPHDASTLLSKRANISRGLIEAASFLSSVLEKLSWTVSTETIKHELPSRTKVVRANAFDFKGRVSRKEMLPLLFREKKRSAGTLVLLDI